MSQHPLPPARHQPHLSIPSTKQSTRKKTKNPEMRSNSQQIISYCLGIRTQNPGLREVDLKRSLREVVTRLTSETRKKHPKERKSYRTAGTHIWIPVLREVDLEPSAKRGTNSTRALVSLY